MHLFPEGFDRSAFLRDHWQKRPLLIRGEAPFTDPLDADELAGLACEDSVESRLILHNDDGQEWRLEHGPFDPQRLSDLGVRNFCLLVQAVDQWHPSARALLQAFDFLPGWRLDDIMASCSGDGGSAGPHFDYYDVFLIQGSGSKRWRIGPVCDSETDVDESSGLRLLRSFRATEEYEVHAGDILYIPARYAHHGVAVGTSLTWSVGFRAPAHAEIVMGLASFLAERCPPEARFRDQRPELPGRIGEIPPATGQQLKQIITNILQDDDFITWFGEHMTRPRYPDLLLEDETETDLPTHLRDRLPLYKAPGARFAFTRHTDRLQVFADGHSLDCPLTLLPLVETLGDHRHDRITLPMHQSVSDAAMPLLETLYNQGSLLKEPPYDDPDID